MPTTPTTPTVPTTAESRTWVDRWDRQQERYVADREERFTVIGDVLAATVGDTPTVLDLGSGPGSLSVRLLERFPGARVLALDADPLLLGLARSAYAETAGLEVVEADLRAEGWTDALTVGRLDAVVSTTALHWLTAAELARVYAACGRLVRPGGVLVDGDHLDAGQALPRLGDVCRAVEDARAVRVGVEDNEEWDAWWRAVGEAPELAGLVGARGARPIAHDPEDRPDLDGHVSLLRAAGFSEVGPVWQQGSDRVLVAVR